MVVKQITTNESQKNQDDYKLKITYNIRSIKSNINIYRDVKKSAYILRGVIYLLLFEVN